MIHIDKIENISFEEGNPFLHSKIQKDFSIEGLRQLNVFFGENGCGKSSLMKYIHSVYYHLVKAPISNPPSRESLMRIYDLLKVVNPEIKSITEEDSHNIWVHLSQQIIPSYKLDDSTHFIWNRSRYICSPTSKVVTLDGFSKDFSKRTLKIVVDFILKEIEITGKQFFVTTSSNEVINTILNVVPEETLMLYKLDLQSKNYISSLTGERAKELEDELGEIDWI